MSPDISTLIANLERLPSAAPVQPPIPHSAEGLALHRTARWGVETSKGDATVVQENSVPMSLSNLYLVLEVQSLKQRRPFCSKNKLALK
jgi:hypothetical protein